MAYFPKQPNLQAMAKRRSITQSKTSTRSHPRSRARQFRLGVTLAIVYGLGRALSRLTTSPLSTRLTSQHPTLHSANQMAHSTVPHVAHWIQSCWRLTAAPFPDRVLQAFPKPAVGQGCRSRQVFRAQMANSATFATHQWISILGASSIIHHLTSRFLETITVHSSASSCKFLAHLTPTPLA